MTIEQAKSELMQIYGMLSPDKQRAIDTVLHIIEQEPKYCDRNICIKNEYNGIGCDECEVTKSQEPKTQESEKINCNITKCENCINHNYCDAEADDFLAEVRASAESEDKE